MPETTPELCPLCRSAEHLLTYQWMDDERQFPVVECSACTVIAPAETWGRLPRTQPQP